MRCQHWGSEQSGLCLTPNLDLRLSFLRGDGAAEVFAGLSVEGSRCGHDGNLQKAGNPFSARGVYWPGVPRETEPIGCRTCVRAHVYTLVHTGMSTYYIHVQTHALRF